MKKFKVSEFVTVTVKRTYWAEAKNEEAAFEMFMDDKLGSAVTEKVLEEEVFGYGVKKGRWK